ncbi:hypothetical protein OKW76_03880 [Sphingomonas sp. S1-29]|uniref:hypothetical protein n=1 Tax=Sphingomonas sp. S1-29 TaxID=2991074 RepID=UPI0022403121|nr:hypothetical protein [Sphingomonas sp. S1-29]UZK70203.1 hypothetical protein OKW76_03880 [Sphingomonas sp. S1-29]
MIARLLSGLAATALIATPVAASAASAAAPAAKLSVAQARTGTAATKTNRQAGVSLFPALLAAAIIAGGVYLVVDSNDDSDSN